MLYFLVLRMFNSANCSIHQLGKKHLEYGPNTANDCHRDTEDDSQNFKHGFQMSSDIGTYNESDATLSLHSYVYRHGLSTYD